jgi:hypothetical protein
MRGPTLPVSLDFFSREDLFSGEDTEPVTTPEDLIDELSNDFLVAITDEEHERLEAGDGLAPFRRNAEIAALYLARSWRFCSPWWADAALQKIFDDKLPVTKATVIAHANAMDLRLTEKGQSKREFRRQKWDDHTYFQVATMRDAGVSAKEASRHAARWRDENTGSDFTTMASTVEKGFPKWAKGSLRGKVWCDQLSQRMERLTPSEELDLIRSNKLRAARLPSLPYGLHGERR